MKQFRKNAGMAWISDILVYLTVTAKKVGYANATVTDSYSQAAFKEAKVSVRYYHYRSFYFNGRKVSYKTFWKMLTA